MDIQIRAIGDYMHGYHRGRLDAEDGKIYPLPQSEADELVKRGLAEIVTDEAPAEAPAEAPVESVDDLIGGEKAEADPENKIEKPAKNKAK